MDGIAFIGPCPACKQAVPCEQLPDGSVGTGYLERVNIAPHGCPDPAFWRRG
jgi:hypothetical protein